MNEIRVWCKAEYGNKRFCSFVEGFISFQFFKEIKTLLRNAMYTFLSRPLNCLLYSFLSFIFCEIQPHLIVLWTVPKQVHLVILKRKFGENWETMSFTLLVPLHLQNAKKILHILIKIMFFSEIVYNHFVIIIILCNYFIIILRYVIMQKYSIRVKMFESDPYFSH